MQRQRSIFDTFPETVDLNQGPTPNHGLNESDDHNIRLSPTERRLLSTDLSGELNFNHENTNHHHSSRSFSSWDVGESSSRRPSDQDSRPMDVNLNLEYGGSNTTTNNNGNNENGQGFRFMNLYKPGSSPEMESDEQHETDCSFGNWGLSCKRKALEGTSSSSSTSQHPSPMVNSPTPTAFTPPNVTERRYNGIRDSVSGSSSGSGSGSVPFNISSNGTPTSSLPFRRLPHSDYLGQHSRNGPILTPPNSSQPLNVQLPGMPRNLLPFSRTGSSSNSGTNSSRNNDQNSYFTPSNETRNMVQDPTNWSLATGRSNSNNGGGGGNYRNDPVWLPPHGQPQRLTELPPWTLFPSPEVESGGHRGHFPILPSGSSSSSEENMVHSRGRNRQPFLRAGPPLMEVPGDEWQTFASDIEGRHRLVSEMRQILNALRRGESLRAEDYMLFDPFINGVSEMHDRHRDMRLDVDNMSYEELLALEERIGDVKTGLSEEVILKSMKQRKHMSFMAISTQYLEPCCICREEYVNGDNIGTLECGHDFHTCCIKQWLSQKNLCPICKMTGLST
ncbi:hypothetical protein LXL04_001612 [Taraxacum kok-saghyz]